LKPGLRAITKTLGKYPEANFYFPHEHRWWEYASAITAFEERYKGNAPRTPYNHQDYGQATRILDVGGGYGILGPALADNYLCTVYEIDTDPKVVQKRNDLGIKNLRTMQKSILDLSEGNGMFDAVFCISVIEHIPEWQKALAKLAERVNKGGLLVLTVDYGESGKEWVNDSERENKFITDNLRGIIGYLEREGFTLGTVDLTFHGPQVFDYTFFRIIAEKRA
jgi:SAM-dependent methyltransferase